MRRLGPIWRKARPPAFQPTPRGYRYGRTVRHSRFYWCKLAIRPLPLLLKARKSVAAKLANPDRASAPADRHKPRFNNGKKRLTGPPALSARAGGGRAARRAENGGPVALGTRRAIKDNVLGATTTGTAPAAEAAQRDTKIGQSRRGRRSTTLRLSEVDNILAAAVFTGEIRAPLNRHTTIHFDAAGIPDPVAAIGKLTKLAGDWLRTQGAPFAYIWVREAGERKGEHVHLLWHVPPRLVRSFARRERGWRKRIGAKPSLGAFHSTPIGRSYRHAEQEVQFGERYSDHLAEIVGYLMKGTEPAAVKALSLGRTEPGGELWGKRSGMSENIGRAARGERVRWKVD